MFQSKRKLHILLIAVFCICLVLGMFASCTGDTPDKPDDSKPPVDSVDYGIDNVYYTTDGDKEYTFSIVKNTFTITGLNGEQKGTFTYKDGTLTLSFSGSDTTTASATIENGVLKLTYNGSSYRMLLRKQFTVTFNTAGGSAVEKQQVMNGGHAVKPQDPTRNGYIFVGWYADEDYKSPFSFDTAIITSDTTVYGRFVKQSEGRTEYTVSLVCEGTVYDPVTTVNGVLYNLPTPKKDGAEFAGWWMSDYQSASKLTCQYTDQQLTQDITLYAVFKTPGTPLVSVGEKKITWQSLGATLSYRVTIMKGDTTIAKSNVGTNEFVFNMNRIHNLKNLSKKKVGSKTNRPKEAKTRLRTCVAHGPLARPGHLARRTCARGPATSTSAVSAARSAPLAAAAGSKQRARAPTSPHHVRCACPHPHPTADKPLVAASPSPSRPPPAQSPRPLICPPLAASRRRKKKEGSHCFISSRTPDRSQRS